MRRSVASPNTMTTAPPICASSDLYVPNTCPSSVVTPPHPTTKTREKPATNITACRKVVRRGFTPGAGLEIVASLMLILFSLTHAIQVPPASFPTHPGGGRAGSSGTTPPPNPGPVLRQDELEKR